MAMLSPLDFKMKSDVQNTPGRVIGKAKQLTHFHKVMQIVKNS